jgi:hypothetical protein
MTDDGDKKNSGVFADVQNAACIVAHPDDETLWTGGTILLNPQIQWTIISLCRKSDKERAGKFFEAVGEYKAEGIMGDLDDGLEQKPLDSGLLKQTIMDLLPKGEFEIIITHSRAGEYTRHLRHEEIGAACAELFRSGKLAAGRLLAFAYEDGNKKYLPRAVASADLVIELPEKIWEKKYEIITKIYGFAQTSFEAKTTPKQEAFWYIK